MKKFGKLEGIDGKDRENILKSVLHKYGPLAVRVRMDTAAYNIQGPTNTKCVRWEWSNKKQKMEENTISHMMLLAGWNENYWLFKNSYGNYDHYIGGNKRPFGVDGWMWIHKSVADTYGLFGPGSSWLFPDVL